MIREYLIRESIDASSGLDLKAVFDQIVDEIKASNLSDMPGGENLINTINQYSEEIDRLEASGQEVDLENKLTKLFQFNSEYVDLKNNAMPFYKYSPGNAALLATQGVTNQLMGTANWWAKRGMKLKPGAKFKIVLRPIFHEGSSNDYTENIQNEIYKEFTFGQVKSTVKDKINKASGSNIPDTETFKGFELYNMFMGQPKDASVEPLLASLQGRNELSQFMLTALGLKASDVKQGYKIGHLYSRDQVIPVDVKVQGHLPVDREYSEDDVQTAEALVSDIVDGFTELSSKEGDIESAADETGVALFHDVIDYIKQITSFQGDEETNMAFFQALLDLNDKVETMRRNLTTYQYSTRNLLFLAMQEDNLTEVGPRTYWFIQNKRPKSGAHGKIILTPITDENPQELAKQVVNRQITNDMVKNNVLRRQFAKVGVTFKADDEKTFTTSELFNMYYGRPADQNVEDLTAWEFQIARFYIDLTGLKRHTTKGYNVAIVYDVNDVEQIPGTESFDRTIEPIVSDISYDGDAQKLIAIRKTLVGLLTELRGNPSLSTNDEAKASLAHKCLYSNSITPEAYKTPAILTGKGKNSRDLALYDFDLMRNEPNENNDKSELIAEIGRLLHLLVHEVAHYNRGKLSSDYTGKPKSQADFIYYNFFDLTPGNRIYYNPNDQKQLRDNALKAALKQAGGNRGWRALSQEEQERRIQMFIRKKEVGAGISTSLTEKGRYYRETQAEIISAMVMKALKIPTKIVGTHLALLSNVDGEKDRENTPAHEVQFYIDITNAILRKIHSKLDVLDEQHQSLKTMIEQILNNKNLLML